MGRKTDDITDNPASEPDLPSLPTTAGQPPELTTRQTRARDSAIVSELKKKLAQDLPPGHPSSPFNEDGSRRPTDTSVKDAERLIPPLTEAQWVDHRQEVTDRLEKALAEGLTTDMLHTIDAKHQIWSADRNRLHASIIEKFYGDASDAPCDRLAIMAGGLFGAGKTTVLDQHAGIDRSKYLTISPDDIKEELARRGMLPQIPGLAPMETSALGHKESSYLARRLALRAMADGRNIIWDISMSSTETTSRRINELRRAEYRDVDAIFVDVPPETSVTRADARHRRGHDRHLAGLGLGGRCVVPDLIRSQADREFGSVNRRVFETLKNRFNHWARYDNSVDGRPPELVESSEKRQRHDRMQPNEESGP